MSTTTIGERCTSFPAFLEEVRKYPGVFLGSSNKSIRSLCHFLVGVQFAEYIHGVTRPFQSQEFDLNAFEAWVDKNFNPQSLTLNSFSLAEYLEGSDERGFDLWFKWYDQFRSG